MLFQKNDRRLYSFYDPTNKKYSFKDQHGNIAIPASFDGIQSFEAGFYCVWVKDVKSAGSDAHYGYVGRDGLFMPPKYDSGFDFSKGFVHWFKQGRPVQMLRDGTFINHRCVDEAVNGIMVINHESGLSRNHVLMDICGNTLLGFPPETYLQPRLSDDEGYTKIETNDRYNLFEGWYIEPDGLLTASKFDGTGKLYLAYIDYRYCFIDNERNIVIDCKEYDECCEFSSGMAKVRKGKKWGYINESGKLAVELKYIKCADFDGETAQVWLPGEYIAGDYLHDGIYIYDNETEDEDNDDDKPIIIKRAFLDQFPDWLADAFRECAKIMNLTETDDAYLLYTDDFFDNKRDEKKCEDDGNQPPADDETSGEALNDNNDAEEMKQLYAWDVIDTLLNCSRPIGLIDKSGSYVMEPKIRNKYILPDGLYPLLIKISENTYGTGYVDDNWNLRIGPIPNCHGEPFYHGYARLWAEVENVTNTGVIDTSGNYVIKPDYYFYDIDVEAPGFPEKAEFSADREQERLIIRKDGNSYTEIPVREEVVPGVYFSDDKSEILNSEGKVILSDFQWYKVNAFTDKYFTFRNSQYKYGIADKNGIVIEPQYGDVFDLGENMLKVCLPRENSYSTGSALIDKDLQIYPLDEDVDIFEKYSEGLVVVETRFERCACGYMDKKGSIVIERKFAKALPFKNGRARVQLKGYWGYINTVGEFVIAPLLDDILTDFRDGYAWVVYLGKVYRMNEYGTLYQENKRVSSIPFLIPAESDGKWGYKNEWGFFDIPPIYDKADYFNHDFGKVYLDSWEIFIDFNGKMISAKLLNE